MLLYLTKISISLTLTYLLYKGLLEGLKVHHFKRFYLLFAMGLSLLLPLISFPNTTLDLLFDSRITEINAIIIGPTSFKNQVEIPTLFPLHTFLYLVYFTGFTITFFKFNKGIYNLAQLRKKGQQVQQRNYRFVRLLHLETPFTFGTTIYLPENTPIHFTDPIIRHELVHVRQYHSLDILLVELLKCLFWFHPMLYLFKNAIALNHEFLADSQVAQTPSQANAYLQLLLNQTYRQNEMPLSSSFNFNLTKKRFIMISKNTHPFKNVLCTAIACIGLFFAGMLSVNAQEKKTTNQQTQEASIESLQKSASYVGGMAAFQRYFISSFHSETAFKTAEKTTAKIIAQFYIEVDGTVSEVQILKNELDTHAAEQVISILSNSPKWIPAQKDGEAVKSQFTLPITLQVPKNTGNPAN